MTTKAYTDRLREALGELVALKDLKDALEMRVAGPNDPERLDYYRRKSLAWKAARSALSLSAEQPEQGAVGIRLLTEASGYEDNRYEYYADGIRFAVDEMCASPPNPPDLSGQPEGLDAGTAE